MKTIKTSELTGAALDWAVAKAEGWGDWDWDDGDFPAFNSWNGTFKFLSFERVCASSCWTIAGPIIEREKILLEPASTHAGWNAISSTGCYALPKPRVYMDGPTPLIAAMRAYVACKLGDRVEVPAELLSV